MTTSTQAVEITQIAAKAAADKLATDVKAFDVSERLPLADVFLIATAANERQVGAVVDNVEEQLLRAGFKPVRREGEREAQWVLLDYLDVVVHVQHKDARELYALDRLWMDCPAIQLPSDEPDKVAV
ncbi:MAG: ribosome silencing factor [Propionibacteriaceae bacterium]|jgi:ribosome-associated protein|nr:ribosome silencing factor [Propionibacteriaceae bacterium]